MKQKLIFPQEVEVWYVLPAIRKRMAMALIQQNLPQKDVAKLLQLTEAAISQYKKDKRGSEDFFSEELLGEVDKSAMIIAKDKTKLFLEMNRLNEIIKKKGIVCSIHKDKSSLTVQEMPCDNCKYGGKA